jgi:hypothetical protein
MQWYSQDVLMNKTLKSYERLYQLVHNFLEDQTKQRNSGARQLRSATPGPSAYVAVGQPSPYKRGMCSNFYYKGKCADQSKCPFTHEDTVNPGGRTRSKGKGKGKGKGDGKGKGKSKGKGKEGKSKGKGSKDRSSSQGKGKGKFAKGKGKGKSKGTEGKGSGVNRTGTSPSGKKEASVCFRYLKHECTWGPSCAHWHPPPCSYWMKGNCNMGDKCPMPHFDKKMAYAAKKAYKASQETKPATTPKTQPKVARGKPQAKPKAKKLPGGHVSVAISPPAEDLSPLDQ